MAKRTRKVRDRRAMTAAMAALYQRQAAEARERNAARERMDGTPARAYATMTGRYGEDTGRRPGG